MTMHYINTTPHKNMPEEIKQLSFEAVSTLSTSVKSSAALLRLCIKMLIQDFGGNGKNLSEDIGSFIYNGLPAEIAMDLKRLKVIGGNAINPGQIDLGDDKQTALRLYNTLNIMTDYLSKPATPELHTLRSPKFYDRLV